MLFKEFKRNDQSAYFINSCIRFIQISEVKDSISMAGLKNRKEWIENKKAKWSCPVFTSKKKYTDY